MRTKHLIYLFLTSRHPWRLVVFSLLCLVLAFTGSMVAQAHITAQPTTTENRIVRCGGVSRPGLAEPGADGSWQGLEVDICRAVAVALGTDHIEFHGYESDAEFDRAGREDDIAFLTGSEIAEHNLSGQVLPGPTVYFLANGILVPDTSPIKSLWDLNGESICYMIGSSAERGLEARLTGQEHLRWAHRAFSEDGEMQDTYQVQNCHAMAGELPSLARYGFDPRLKAPANRLLPDTISEFPLILTTRMQNGRLAAVAAWTVATLMNGDRSASAWYTGGADAMPVRELDLARDWQEKVLHTIGTYNHIYQRNLGDQSPLHLSAGPNRLQSQGGLLLPPYLE